MEQRGMTYIYLKGPRKQLEHPDGWNEIAFARGDYVDCGIFGKPTAELTEGDQGLARAYGERPHDDAEWIEPNVTCKGSMALGTDCGWCSKCARERARWGSVYPAMPEHVHEAREFLIDRYIRTHQTPSAPISRETAEAKIISVMTIMDTRWTELALRFGWVDPTGKVAPLAPFHPDNPANPVAPVASLQTVDERLRKLTSVIGYMLDGLKYSIRGDNDEAAKIVAGARAIFIKLLEGKS